MEFKESAKIYNAAHDVILDTRRDHRVGEVEWVDLCKAETVFQKAKEIFEKEVGIHHA